MGGVVGDGSVDADDTLLEKTGEDVVGSLSSGGVFYHHWDQAECAIALCELVAPISSTVEELRGKQF